MATNAAPAKRSYRSPLRAEQAERTRAAVMDAASHLFTTKGWGGTGMRDIAAEAGVATETLYAHFSSKRRLFEAVVDVAVVGDQLDLAVAERPEFAAMGEGSRPDRIAAAARLVTTVHERTVRFAKVVREAASNDAQIAELLTATRERQRQDVESGLALIGGRTPSPDERDGAWAILSPEVYVLLVDESGWSVEQYERWLTQTLDRLIPKS